MNVEVQADPFASIAPVAPIPPIPPVTPEQPLEVAWFDRPSRMPSSRPFPALPSARPAPIDDTVADPWFR